MQIETLYIPGESVYWEAGKNAKAFSGRVKYIKLQRNARQRVTIYYGIIVPGSGIFEITEPRLKRIELIS